MPFSDHDSRGTSDPKANASTKCSPSSLWVKASHPIPPGILVTCLRTFLIPIVLVQDLGCHLVTTIPEATIGREAIQGILTTLASTTQPLMSTSSPTTATQVLHLKPQLPNLQCPLP